MLWLHVVAACSDAPSSEWVDLPVPSSLPNLTATRTSTETWSERSPLGRSLGPPLDTLWQFGSFDDPSAEALGRVEDAQWLAGRGFVALDRQSARIFLLSEEGRLLADLVAPGAGPGEFADPLDLDVTSRGTVVVLDRAARLQEFSIEQLEFRFLRTTVLPFLPDDICLTGDGVIGVGLTALSPGLIHAFGPEGAIERSFGTGYQHDVPLVARAMSEAALSCSQDQISVAFRRLGEIHTYSRDGGLLWVHRLRPFYPFMNQARVGQAELRSGLERGSRDRGHYILTYGHLGSAYFLQLGVRSVDALDAGLPYEMVDTYLIDPQGGRGTTSEEWRTRILAANDSLALGYSSEPRPVLLGLRRKLRR